MFSLNNISASDIEAASKQMTDYEAIKKLEEFLESNPLLEISSEKEIRALTFAFFMNRFTLSELDQLNYSGLLANNPAALEARTNMLQLLNDHVTQKYYRDDALAAAASPQQGMGNLVLCVKGLPGPISIVGQPNDDTKSGRLTIRNKSALDGIPPLYGNESFKVASKRVDGERVTRYLDTYSNNNLFIVACLLDNDEIEYLPLTGMRKNADAEVICNATGWQRFNNVFARQKRMVTFDAAHCPPLTGYLAGIKSGFTSSH